MQWSLFQIIVMSIVMIISFLNAGLFFYRVKQTEDVKDKRLLRGFALITLVGAIMWVIWIASNLSVNGIFVDFIFYVDTSAIPTIPEFWESMIYTMLMDFSIILMPTFYYFTFERVVQRTKYIFTIISISFIIYISILWWYVFTFQAEPSPPSLLIIKSYFNKYYFAWYGSLIITIILTFYSRGEAKAIACFFLLSRLIIIIAEPFNWLRYYFYIGHFIAPILYLISMLVISLPLLMHPKYFPRVFKIWKVTGIMVPILFFICGAWLFFSFGSIYHPAGMDYIIYNSDVTLEFFLRGIIAAILFCVQYIGLKYEKPLKDKKEIGFKAFLRPKTITEEEVTFHKEKKICLVCKGKVGGFNTYICNGCDVLYCQNCAKALIDLDNICWVCEEPIDKSKPIKPILIEGIEEDRGSSEKETSELVK